jgi:AAA15 family ATPase/GTPase
VDKAAFFLDNKGIAEKILPKIKGITYNYITKGLSEQPTGKGSVIMKKGSNPTDIKQVIDSGVNVELREKKNDIGKELKGNQKKLDKNHNGKIDGQDFKILKGQKKKKSVKTDTKDKEVKEWVESLAENNYHSFTSKNEIMEMIQFKLQEAGPNVNIGHNDIPEFMTHDGDVETKPAKPKVTPGTKPKPHNPNQPGPFTKPKPKAEKK